MELSLAQVDWQSMLLYNPSAIDFYYAFLTTVHDIIAQCVPLRCRPAYNLRNKKPQPRNLRSCKNKKRKIWRKLVSRPLDPCLRNCYRDCCHEWNRLLHKRAVDTEKIVIDSNNLGAFYRHINNRMSHRDRICAIIKDDGSVLTDDTDKANEFNRYFASVGVADNDHLPVYNSLIDDQNCLTSLVIEEPDVLLAINSM